MTIKGQTSREATLSFEDFEKALELGLGDAASSGRSNDSLDPILVFEAKAGCSLGMLQCLDRSHRIAYVLGEVLEFASSEAALIMDVSESDYRQKLHRSRERLHSFMRKNCGLVSAQSACHCRLQTTPAIRAGRVQPKALLFSNFASPEEIRHEVDSLIREAEVFHLTNKSRKPLEFAGRIRQMIRICKEKAD